MTMTPVLTFDFNPDQPRDDHGRWTAGGGGGDSPSSKVTGGLADKYREGTGDRKGMGDIKIDASTLHDLRTPPSFARKYIDENGNWTPERQALHDQIVNRLTAGVPSAEHPRLVMTGGGPAAGKSEALAAGGVQTPDHYVKIDSDEIKQMLPDTQQMMADGDKTWAAASHEESSYLAKRVQAAAEENQQNIVLDGTGDSSAEKLIGKIQAAQDAGYTVEGHYVTRDVEAAVTQALARGEKTGRYVPESVLRNTYAKLQTTVPEAAPYFDSFSMFDNNGAKGEPTLIATGGGGAPTTIHDEALWERFLTGGPLALPAAH